MLLACLRIVLISSGCISGELYYFVVVCVERAWLIPGASCVTLFSSLAACRFWQEAGREGDLCLIAQLEGSRGFTR